MAKKSIAHCLIAIKQVKTAQYFTSWEARCSCGKTHFLTETNSPQDSVGKRFGRLTVVREVRKTELVWVCDCDCGTRKPIRASTIKRGKVSACGCLHRQRIRTHHQSHTPEFHIWCGMRQRTSNPNNPSFHNYGGRGIKVCERWHKFENFISDVGKRPTPRHSLERIDNNRGYEPDNVKWATRDEQSRNHRRNHRVTFNGETLCVSEWARRLGVDPGTVNYRLDRWPIEAALTTPRLTGRKFVSRKTHQFTAAVTSDIG